MVKNPPAMQETQVQSLGQEIPWRRKWQPTLAFLLGKSHGQRSLTGYSPWGRKTVRHDLMTKQQWYNFQKVKADSQMRAPVTDSKIHSIVFWLVGCFFFFPFSCVAQGLRDLNSPTRNQTHTPMQWRRWKRGVLTTGPPRKVHAILINGQDLSTFIN